MLAADLNLRTWRLDTNSHHDDAGCMGPIHHKGIVGTQSIFDSVNNGYSKEESMPPTANRRVTLGVDSVHIDH